MRRKIFISILILILAVLSLGAAKQQSEKQRMGIFISNFTELGMYDFDVYEGDGEDGRLTHLGDPINTSELIKFGIGHNVINNPKSTVKPCPDKNCEYGNSIMSAQSVSASLKRYFNMSIKHNSVLNDLPQIYFDGKNYHFYAEDFKPERVYYADVQNVSKRKGIITMTGELYDVKNKSDRPATFEATAKPHKYNNKDTWAILSLTVDWE